MRRRKEVLPRSLVVFTVGHSTRSIDDFLELLRSHGVTCVADVRTIPKSRHNPQFNSEALTASLRLAGLRYVHLPALGGLRHPRRNSVNRGWRNASFRGYADYMQTEEFAEALQELLQLAGKEQLVLMCAEAVPWRCHRSLIADALLVRGFPVEHIMTPKKRQMHVLTPFAKVRRRRITYPAPAESGTAAIAIVFPGTGPALRTISHHDLNIRLR